MRRLRRWLARGLVAVGRVAVALLDTEPPRRFAATALALAARGRLDPGGAEVEVATLRFVPRGLALAPVAAAGRVTARPGGPVRVRGFHLASGRSRLDAEAELDGTGAIDAHLALAPLAAADVRALAPRSALATDLRARLRMRGPWHALAVRAHADLGRGGGLHARAALDATARPVAYAARLAFARLDPGAVLPWLPRAEASGQLAFRGEGGAHRLRGEVRTPLGQALAGTASLTASVAGPLSALAAQATATVEHPLYGALGADRARARLALDGLGSRASHGTLHLEAPALRVARASPADALADLEWRRAGDTDRARLAAHANGEDGRTQTLAASVERTAARTTGRLEEVTLALLGGPPWRLTAPAAFAIDHGPRTGGITLAAGGQRIVFSGRVGLAGASDATLAVERLALGPLCVLVDGPR